MPTENVTLKSRLSRHREIDITVIGRRSGRAISIPVWFVLEGAKLYLLPVQGSDTQWYKNVLKNPSIQIAAGDAKGNSAPLRSGMPHRFRQWRKNPALNTVLAT